MNGCSGWTPCGGEKKTCPTLWRTVFLSSFTAVMVTMVTIVTMVTMVKLVVVIFFVVVVVVFGTKDHGVDRPGDAR